VTITVDSLTRACNDGVDNDQDALIDAADPGCERGFDDDEADPAAPPACADGLDNDEDGLVDHPADPDCAFAGGVVEAARCGAGTAAYEVGSAGGEVELFFDAARDLVAEDCFGEAGVDELIALTVDQLSDVEITAVEPGGESEFGIALRTGCPGAGLTLSCMEPFGGTSIRAPHLAPGLYFVAVQKRDDSEALSARVRITVTPRVAACNDGVDNDEDALTDALDPGCSDALDADEADPELPAACNDDLDNDGDGLVDFPEDPECATAGAGVESLRCPAGTAALEVGAEGAAFDASFGDAGALGLTSCGNPDDLFVVSAVTVTETSRIIVDASDDVNFDSLVVAIRPDCISTQEIACDSGFGSAGVSTNALEPRHLLRPRRRVAELRCARSRGDHQRRVPRARVQRRHRQRRRRTVRLERPGLHRRPRRQRGRSGRRPRLRRRRRQRRGRRDGLPGGLGVRRRRRHFRGGLLRR
jgi:hypothetical protein